MRGRQNNRQNNAEETTDSEADEDNTHPKTKKMPIRRSRGRLLNRKKQRVHDESDDEDMSIQPGVSNAGISQLDSHDNSGEDSDDSFVPNSSISSYNTSKKNIPTARRGRGRPASARNKRQRTLADSDDTNEDNNDVSTQPSSSNAGISRLSGQNNSGEDSEESLIPASSISSCNSNTKQKTPTARRGRGRPAKNRIRVDSDDDDNNVMSQQPSSSNATSSTTNGINDSGGESDASYIPNSDISSNRKKMPTARRGTGRPVNNRKQKFQADSNDDNSDNDDNGASTSSLVNVFQRRFSLRRNAINGGNTQNFINGRMSPQPSTSNANNSNIVDESSKDESSSSESVDSDDTCVDVRPSKKNVPEKRKGRPKAPIGKKQKVNNTNEVNSRKQQKEPRHSSSHKASKDTAFNPDLVENLAQKVVYCLFIEDQKKYAIKKKAIVNHVFKEEVYSSKLYQAVITKANSILKKTYGMELMELENQKDGYLIVNILSRELGIDDFMDLTRLKQQQYGLILYLLTIIFMNENIITEDELEKALKPLKIDLTSKIPHPVFGDVKKYITVELVKQMYLNYECVSKDPRRYEITWGVRAKEEVDKMDLLNFACQIMDDTTPESWILQFRDAKKSASPV